MYEIVRTQAIRLLKMRTAGISLLRGSVGSSRYRYNTGSSPVSLVDPIYRDAAPTELKAYEQRTRLGVVTTVNDPTSTELQNPSLAKALGRTGTYLYNNSQLYPSSGAPVEVVHIVSLVSIVFSSIILVSCNPYLRPPLSRCSTLTLHISFLGYAEHDAGARRLSCQCPRTSCQHGERWSSDVSVHRHRR